MSGYRDSDSSDEDVCFGEYTIEEAKRDLQRKYVPRKINRRHTHSLVSKLTEKQISGKILAKDFDRKINISTDSNINCNSEYVTANETTSTDRLSQNSEFLEKLTKVIDDPVSEASSYNTAFNQTNVDNVEDTFLARFKNHTLVLDNVHQTLVENTVLSTEDSVREAYNYDCQNDESSNEIINDSIINISDDSLESFSANKNLNFLKDQILSNQRVTPKELLYETPNKFINDVSSTESQVIDHTNSLYENTAEVQSKNRDLLDDENNVNKSSFAYESLYVSDSDTEPKDYSCNISLNYSNEYFSDSPENTSFDLMEPIQRYDREIVDYKQLSKISEKTEFTTYTADNSMHQPQEKSNDSSSANVSSSKKCIDLEIPYIINPECPKRSTTLDVQDIGSELSKKSELYKQSQLSKCSEASSLSPTQRQEEAFDDTLEEINRLLEHGVDYQMPESMSPLREPFGPDKIISGSFMNNSFNSCGLENKSPRTKTLSSKSLDKCKNFNSTEKISKPSVEGKWSSKVKSGFQEKSTNSLSSNATNLFTKHTEKLEVNSDFKVPLKPVKKLATPSKLPKPTFKSTISPISVYINHSPKYCPMRKPQHSGNPHKKSSKLQMPDISVKENIVCASQQEIPEVIYRPAKHQEIRTETGIILPESLRKLIKVQVVTKHEQRIQGDEFNQSIERRLMESDLSMDISHSSQDMSILTNKQPFSIRKF